MVLIVMRQLCSSSAHTEIAARPFTKFSLHIIFQGLTEIIEVSMKNNRFIHIKNFLLPCLLFSVLAGGGTGVVIFLFKLSAGWVISLSDRLYDTVRASPSLLPLLLLGAVLTGLCASLLLIKVPECRGGGIPTAIALLKGLVTFRWLRSLLSVFSSAMLTYLAGVPLGNEGPSVQMGTAVGRGLVGRFPAWSRYIMTGGASAGFAAATGAPLTGILFAFEEAHRRFSPLLFLVSSISALTATGVIRALCSLAHMDAALFHMNAAPVLPMKYLWTAALIGILTGAAAALFTKGWLLMRRLLRRKMESIPLFVKVTVIFFASAVVGYFSPRAIGSGHHLVESLAEGQDVGVSLLAVLLLRAVLLLAANNADVTGGLFVPTLAFGAITGSLSGSALISVGLLPEEYYSLAVVVGITAFLSASSRTPLMAVAFAAEALGGLPNLLPIAIGGTAAFLCIETIGIPDFTDIVVEAKEEAAHAGKTASTVDYELTVSPDAFAVGKEIRDILWPASCTVLSVKRADTYHAHGGTGIGEGDVLTIHCRTYDADETLARLSELVGEQTADRKS